MGCWRTGDGGKGDNEAGKEGGKEDKGGRLGVGGKTGVRGRKGITICRSAIYMCICLCLSIRLSVSPTVCLFVGMSVSFYCGLATRGNGN